MPNSVAIIEDDSGLRAELAALLETHPPRHTVQAFATAEEARQAFQNRIPGTVITDLQLPGIDGVTLIRELKALFPATRFLVLTVVDDPETIFRALEAGASGYLLKRLPAARILEAVNQLESGGTPVSSQVARLMVEHFNRLGAARREEDSLTAREAEVLDLLCTGYRSKEMASRLGVGVDTISTHIRHIYEKLHVSSRAEAVAKRMGSAPPKPNS